MHAVREIELTRTEQRSPLARLKPFLFFVLALLLWSVTAGSRAVAEESNPFGLPVPRDPRSPGAVMLHGGGNGLARDPYGNNDRETANLIRRTFSELAGGAKAKIVFMPSAENAPTAAEAKALSGDANGSAYKQAAASYEARLSRGENYGAWAQLGGEFVFVYPELNAVDFQRRLQGATGIWLPEHDQERLPTLFAEGYPAEVSPFQTALREIVAGGGVVGGLGGASSSLAETVIAADAEDDGGWTRARLRFGLALIHGAVVDQNFDKRAGRLERMADLLRNGPRLNRVDETPGVERRTIGLGVDRHTVLVLQGNHVRVLGRGQGHVFLKSNGDRTVTWRTIDASDGAVAIHDGRNRPAATSESTGSAAPANVLRPSVNPFGLPKKDERTPPLGTVVLHGGKNTSEAVALYPRLAANHPDRGRDGVRSVLLHCPAATKRYLYSEFHPEMPDGKERRVRFDEYRNQTFAEWKSLETGKQFDEVKFIAPDDENAAAQADQFVPDLQSAHALWFSGGEQDRLVRLFGSAGKPTRFQQEVINLVRRGGVVGGTSAGLAIMPQVMIAGQTENGGGPVTPQVDFGFGVLQNVFAEQHFDARNGRLERFSRQLRSPSWPDGFARPDDLTKMIGVAVDERTALVVRSNQVQVTGEKQAHLFLRNRRGNLVVWHALKSGDSATVLQNEAGEYVLELDDWRFEN